MKISVVIPTYNRYEVLKRALGSVFAQSHLPDEVIVIDDGSSDNTSNIQNDFPSLEKLLALYSQGTLHVRETEIKKRAC